MKFAACFFFFCGSFVFSPFKSPAIRQRWMSIAWWEYDLLENDAESYSMVDRTFMVVIVPLGPAWRTDVNAVRAGELTVGWWCDTGEVADCTGLRKWKWLLVNGCECKNQISTGTEFLNFRLWVTEASVCSKAVMKSNDASLEQRAKFNGVIICHLIL